MCGLPVGIWLSRSRLPGWPSSPPLQRCRGEDGRFWVINGLLPRHFPLLCVCLCMRGLISHVSCWLRLMDEAECCCLLRAPVSSSPHPHPHDHGGHCSLSFHSSKCEDSGWNWGQPGHAWRTPLECALYSLGRLNRSWWSHWAMLGWRGWGGDGWSNTCENWLWDRNCASWCLFKSHTTLEALLPFCRETESQTGITYISIWHSC